MLVLLVLGMRATEQRIEEGAAGSGFLAGFGCSQGIKQVSPGLDGEERENDCVSDEMRLLGEAWQICIIQMGKDAYYTAITHNMGRNRATAAEAG